ncbi:STAS domain-containing protein [Streptomyces sp. VRA16 Mangrove soil]|uniref:STAS domain-containing protein n=1 Tax=Streptomyces sp. VRA16 Mangrove soil TaxID=2817434 RepID=UPI001A9F8427|nr:STAS domain-containing protein [Streptomyces sp. VRA16 Mangrove soil]MBO1334505.1 STAS domain-containing protein [Streptomyces sp. VRA16 Mangrove soil]
MRQGNHQDYVHDDFGDFEGSGLFRDIGVVAGLTDLDDVAPEPRIRTVDDCAVVELAGDIDLMALHRLAPLLDAVAAGPYRVVAVDLTATTFFDCSGLTLLVRTHRRAAERGGRVTVVCRHRLTLRIIELAGLDEVLCPATTVEQALL